MSDKHRDTLMRNLRLSGNTHIKPDENVAVKIAETQTSESDLSPVQRKHKERGERQGKNVKGSFEKLRARVQSALANGGEEMSKALRVTGASTVMKTVKVERVPLAKTVGAKLDAARATMAKALGGNAASVGATSLEAGYNPESATLTGGDALRKQSLPKKVFVKMEPAPLTGDQITKAASAALTAGAITGAEANTIATHVALNGGKHCAPDLLKKIGSHAK